MTVRADAHGSFFSQQIFEGVAAPNGLTQQAVNVAEVSALLFFVPFGELWFEFIDPLDNTTIASISSPYRAPGGIPLIVPALTTRIAYRSFSGDRRFWIMQGQVIDLQPSIRMR